MIIAHRGNGGKYKENTINAIVNSLNSPYCDGVEFDIRETKDNIFILSHNMLYNKKIVYKTLYKDLDGAESLNDLLKTIQSKKIIMIEIKEERNNFILLKHLHSILRKYKLNYYIMSFNYKLITYFKKKYPSYKCGLLIGIKINKNLINNNLDFNAVNIKHIDKATDKDFVWTINEIEKIKIISNNIITDKPVDIYNFIYDKK